MFVDRNVSEVTSGHTSEKLRQQTLLLLIKLNQQRNTPFFRNYNIEYMVMIGKLRSTYNGDNSFIFVKVTCLFGRFACYKTVTLPLNTNRDIRIQR